MTGEYIYGAEGMIAKLSPHETDLMYFYTDHLGSVRQVEQNTQLRDYFPFGQALSSAGDETAYRFTGKELDAHTDLYYFGARYYDASIGRWLAVDPLADKYPSLSPYNYCANNPLRFIDPDGRAIFKRGRTNRLTITEAKAEFFDTMIKYFNKEHASLQLYYEYRLFDQINYFSLNHMNFMQYETGGMLDPLRVEMGESLNIATQYENRSIRYRTLMHNASWINEKIIDYGFSVLGKDKDTGKTMGKLNLYVLDHEKNKYNTVMHWIAPVEEIKSFLDEYDKVERFRITLPEEDKDTDIF